MRGPGDRRVGVLVAVTGASALVVAMLVFAVLGFLVGPVEAPNPASAPNAVEAANPRSVASGPGLPSQGEPPSGPSAPASRPSTAGPSWPPGSSAGTRSPSAGAPGDAPSENLRRLAVALRFTYKSTTGLLTVPAGLNLTASVEISMMRDEVGPRPTLATQDYNNATGNRSIFLFPPGDGRARAVASVVTMAERGANGTAIHAVWSNVTIEPLYDITVAAFGRSYREVGQSSNLGIR
jgi:hypothetical protein